MSTNTATNQVNRPVSGNAALLASRPGIASNPFGLLPPANPMGTSANTNRPTSHAIGAGNPNGNTDRSTATVTTTPTITRPVYRDMVYTVIPAGTNLFHADIIKRNRPIPTYCPDTGKTGVYFAADNTYLAETKCVELMKPMIITHYLLNRDVKVTLGKYEFTRGYTKYPTSGWGVIDPEDNVSHYDDSLWSTDVNTIDYGDASDFRHAELFLVASDLDGLTYIDAYTITIAECMRKWYKQSWFEEMVEKYVLPTWRTHGCKLPKAPPRPNVDDLTLYQPYKWASLDDSDDSSFDSDALMSSGSY